MKLVVAVREQSASKARDYLSGLGAEVIKSRFEAQDPALRNLLDGLVVRGLELERANKGLHWYLVASPLAAEHWLAHESVAVCFAHAWFHQQAMAIRYLKGIAYCDAAAAWADFLPFEKTPAGQWARQGELDWRGLPVIATADKPDGLTGAEKAEKPLAEPAAKVPALKTKQLLADAREVLDPDATSCAPVKPARRLSLKKKADLLPLEAEARGATPVAQPVASAKPDSSATKKTRQRKRPAREHEEQLDLFG